MEILLQSELLQWARHRTGLTVDSLAEKIHAKPSTVRAWEESGRLTLAQAERLAHAARIPLGYLYFPTPPKEDLPVQDFRTVEGVPVEAPSAELLDTLYEALRKQEWYRGYLLDEGAEVIPFVGSLVMSGAPFTAAERIRSTMGITSAFASGASNVREALQRQVERIEAGGIMVLRNGIVGNNTHRPLNVQEFRGFALSDRYAPLIFMNAKDAVSAQIFTLLHELVHLWLGVSGVSNPSLKGDPSPGIESFCNAVAAELLVPENEFRQRWGQIRSMSDPFGMLAREFKVSLPVILLRARDLGILTEAGFKQRYREAEARFDATASKAATGGNFYATQISRYGRPFIRALVASTLEGKTSHREALNLLSISKLQTFKKLAEKAI